MNIDKAIHSEISTDLADIETDIQKTWSKLVSLIHEREKLTLYKLVSTLPNNDRPIHLLQENTGGGTARGEDTNSR